MSSINIPSLGSVGRHRQSARATLRAMPNFYSFTLARGPGFPQCVDLLIQHQKHLLGCALSGSDQAKPHVDNLQGVNYKR
jgi:hypothetical protein